MTETIAPQPAAEASGLDLLLARVAAGDRAAFQALYRDTSALLLGICVSVLRDRAEAEDALQEAYVAIWHKAAQFDRSRAAAITWLGSIARHRAIDRRRGAGSTATWVTLDVVEQHAADDGRTAPPPDDAQSAVRLDSCMGELEPQRQRLIRAAFVEGATYSELAARCGSPLGTVKSWIRRSLLQLRACLEQ